MIEDQGIISLETVADKVAHVIAFDFGEHEKWKNSCIVLRTISSMPGKIWRTSELAQAANIGVREAGKALRKLVHLTAAYGEQYGFRIIDLTKGRFAEYAFQDLGEVSQNRKRRLVTAPRGPELMKISAEMHARIARIAGLELHEGVPDEWESLVHNSPLLRREEAEWHYVMDLIAARRTGHMVRSQILKARYDIPDEDKRLGHTSNLFRTNNERALQDGFFLTSVIPDYHAISFFDPEKREEALTDQFDDELVEACCLDRVIPFDEGLLKKRLKRIPLSKLGGNYRRFIRQIGSAQTRNQPFDMSDLDMSRGQQLHLMKHTRANRFDFNFWVRCRLDGKLNVVLIDQEHYKELHTF